VRERVRNPGGDLISWLSQQEVDGAPITVERLHSVSPQTRNDQEQASYRYRKIGAPPPERAGNPQCNRRRNKAGQAHA